MILPFLGSSDPSQSPNASVQRTVNWYVEPIEVAEGKARVVLYPTPGVEVFCRLSDGPVRALFAQNGRAFCVSGSIFYELFTDGTSLARGVVASSDLPATISSNGEAGGQLGITSGVNFYTYNLLTNTGPTVRASAANCTMAGFLDGYFIALDTATATLKVSTLEDGSVWDPTMVGQRNTAADKWVAMLISHREVWLLGSQKTDVWYNSGALFPLEPIPGAFMQVGCAAPYSAAVLGASVMWLGANENGQGIVWRAQGYQPVRVSHSAMEHAISQYSTVADAIGWTYQDQGHGFYVLQFPTAKACWVYDANTNQWHERLWWNTTTASYDCYRPMFHCFAFGKHLVGDRLTGAIYDMSINHRLDADGAAIRRLRQGQHLCAEQQWQFYPSAQLDMETGVGTSAYPNPKVMLQWSDDGGHTWSRERWESAGSMGTFGKQVTWNRLGRSRDRVFRVVVSDPVPWRLINFYAPVEGGTS